MKIYVTGANGMLGKAVIMAALQADYPVVPLNRARVDVTNLPQLCEALKHADSADAVINCAGVREGGDKIEMGMVNGVVPHYLAILSERLHFRLIHISTDCVFSGWERNSPLMNAANAQPRPNSLYGRMKLAGEPTGKNVVVVRTSFIGTDHGLWHWVANHEPGHIVGWREAWWSGSTVAAVAELLVRMATDPKQQPPIVHAATTRPTTKAKVVCHLISYLGRNDLLFVEDGTRVDRSLLPTHGYVLPSLEEALPL